MFTAKGGDAAETEGRKCICNALLATMDIAQIRNGKHVESAIITSGDDLPQIRQYFKQDGSAYRASDVVAMLLSRVEALV